MVSYSSIPLEKFSDVYSSTTELSSVALGGKIVSVSDEFFAEASHLLLIEPAPKLTGQFGPNGALYSGWESRRHNPTYDWCIIKLGTTGTLVGFDIDTTHFNGNEAPAVSVEAVLSPTEVQVPDDVKWTEILPKVKTGPSSRHLFTIPESSKINYVKLNMYPDGGIARFRVYGHVSPVYPQNTCEPFDLAHVFAGGRVVFTSDQHFGVGSNLILPGRGKDMGDGWETKRSRQRDHKDWVIIKLGVPAILSTAEIDTIHFKGNFPESVDLHALQSTEEVPESDSPQWSPILPRTKLGPHRKHFFQLENVERSVYTHIKATIYPDGGIKRVRIVGVRADNVGSASTIGAPDKTNVDTASGVGFPITRSLVTTRPIKVVPVLPLTPEAFAAFGQVIEAYGDHAAAPRNTKITPANMGTASKFHKLALVNSTYPPNSNETTGLSVYRCKPAELSNGELELKVLERHPFTNQAFIPMGGGPAGGEALNDPGEAYLVVVAQNGSSDKPDIASIRAFIANAGQGIMYKTAIWHQPMTVLYKAMDFTCVETQIGNGDAADCEINELAGEDVVIKLKVQG
ncbi:galactose-binding domain-like protein [Hygrophoropsis aurantiaca]|uniref:Galactose-binding domain-like protein n=1 Tax=Hygrophoropsis aurantiaca TaxID=72124 RepID=A0ACB8AF59_9AGAM|nr:galactose-binding domain-like protein [Hygrophoropsis aurantiaca]